MAGKKEFLLGLDIDVTKAKEGLGSLIRTAGKLGGIFSGIGIAAAGMMQDQFDDYKELNDTLKAMGQTGNFTFQTINAAMSSEMTDASAVRGEIEGISKAMLEMRALGYTNNTGFAMIGASMNDTMDTLLQKTQRTMQYLTQTGQTAKAKKLADVLGANELYYVLRESNDVFKKMSKNGIINQKNLDQMQQVSRSWSYMKNQFSRTKMSLQMELAPAITTMIKAIGDVITSEPLNTTIKIMAKTIGAFAMFISKTPPTILSTILTAILISKGASLLGFRNLGSIFAGKIGKLFGMIAAHPKLMSGVLKNAIFLPFKFLLSPILHPLKTFGKFVSFIKPLAMLLKSGFTAIVKSLVSFGLMLIPHLIPIALIGLGIMGILSIVRLIGKKMGLIDTKSVKGDHGQIHDIFTFLDAQAEKRRQNGENVLMAEMGAYKDIIQATIKGAKMGDQERLHNSLQYYANQGRGVSRETADNLEYYKVRVMGGELYRPSSSEPPIKEMARNSTANNQTIININTSRVDEELLKKFQRRQELKSYNAIR